MIKKKYLQDMDEYNFHETYKEWLPNQELVHGRVKRK